MDTSVLRFRQIRHHFFFFGSFPFIFLVLESPFLNTNSVSPDQTQRSVASDLRTTPFVKVQFFCVFHIHNKFESPQAGKVLDHCLFIYSEQ